MKKGFRQSMVWLHTWAGLVSGWVLFLVFLTGSATYFKDEITRWMQPERPLHSQVQSLPSTTEMAVQGLEFLRSHADGEAYWVIRLPNDGSRAGNNGSRGYPTDLRVWWNQGLQNATLDPITGVEKLPVLTRSTEGGELFRGLHWQLHYIDTQAGMYIVGVCSLIALLALITGVVAHKKIFADFFTFRLRKGPRSWLDGHNVVGVMALPFFVMMLYTGLAERQTYLFPVPAKLSPDARKPVAMPLPEASKPIAYADIPLRDILSKAEQKIGAGEIGEIAFHRSGVYTPWAKARSVPIIAVSRSWGTQLPFTYLDSNLQYNALTGEFIGGSEFGQDPRVRTKWWMVGLHRAWFAGAGLRWLLFISGLLGCVMIATGLVLWSVKRREKHIQRNAVPFGLRLVEWLNVGTLVGLPVGVAAYFWANRLLPVSMADRADWEVHCLFFTWGWLLLYAALRPIQRAWPEMLWLATAAFGLIPVLNALTTNKHLGATLAHGDWVLAGVDLTMLVLAAVFGFAAWKVQRKQANERRDTSVGKSATSTEVPA